MINPSPRSKEKRGIASARRRRHLLLLVTDYQELQAKYPELRGEIQDDIDDHMHQAARTRSADRRAVLAALEEWRIGLTFEEITDDTGLSSWTVRGVLDELQKTALVGFRERVQDRERGRRARIFFLLQTTPLA